MKTVSVLSVSLILCACSNGPKFDQLSYKRVDLRNAEADLSLPKSMLVELHKITDKPDKPGSEKASKNEGKTVDAAAEGDIGLIAPTVLLVEGTKGILRGENFQLELGRGGGTFNLDDYVDLNQKGDFLLNFDIPGITDATRTKVFFISRTRREKIGDETYGMGCDKFVDISSYFNSHIRKQGLRLTTLHNLYGEAAVGTFIIAIAHDERWQMTEITITSPHLESISCRRAGDIAKSLIDGMVRSTVNL